MENMNISAEWSEWDYCHGSKDQEKRLASARAAACTPTFVDVQSAFAYFQGDHGRYETFLDRCDCADFRRRELPCKHMYRLALELGLLPGPYATYLHGGYTWTQAVEIVETYPDAVQQEFITHLHTRCKSSEPCRRKKCPELDALITGGVLEEYPEKETAKFKTVRLIEDFMADASKLKKYFSRKFSSSTYFDGENFIPEPLPDDDVTAFLRERGFA